MAACDSENESAKASCGNEKKHSIIIIWEIENAILLTSEHLRVSVATPHFKIRTLKIRTFTMKLTPKKIYQKTHYVRLEFILQDKGFGFPIDMEWSFLGDDESTLLQGTELNHYPIPKDGFYMTKMPTYNEVFVERRSEFLKSGNLTLRMCIWKASGDLDADEYISVRSRLEAVEDSVLWNIPEFTSIPLKKELTFPVALEPWKDSDFFSWKFVLLGESLLDSRAAVHFSSITFPRTWEITCGVFLLDSEQNIVKTVVERPNLFADGNVKCWNIELMSRKELLKKESQMLKNDVLTLLCKLSAVQTAYIIQKCCYGLPNQTGGLGFLGSSSQVSEQSANPSLDTNGGKEPVSLSGEKPSPTLKLNPETSEESAEQAADSIAEEDSLSVLVENLLSMYHSKTLSDFELRCGEHSFAVHKNILSARSPVFRTKFSSNNEKGGSDSMDMADLESSVLDKMLVFLYTGKVELLNPESALNLYYLAAQYRVESLKRECCSFLQSNISTKNVCDLLGLADEHQESALGTSILQFISTHFYETVSSPEWEELLKSNHELASKAMHAICVHRLAIGKYR